MLFNIRHMEQKSQNMCMVCETKNGGYCTDVDAYTIKQQQVSVRAKCYNKK